MEQGNKNVCLWLSKLERQQRWSSFLKLHLWSQAIKRTDRLMKHVISMNLIYMIFTFAIHRVPTVLALQLKHEIIVKHFYITLWRKKKAELQVYISHFRFFFSELRFKLGIARKSQN